MDWRYGTPGRGDRQRMYVNTWEDRQSVALEDGAQPLSSWLLCSFGRF